MSKKQRLSSVIGIKLQKLYMPIALHQLSTLPVTNQHIHFVSLYSGRNAHIFFSQKLT